MKRGYDWFGLYYDFDIMREKLWLECWVLLKFYLKVLSRSATTPEFWTTADCDTPLKCFNGAFSIIYYIYFIFIKFLKHKANFCYSTFLKFARISHIFTNWGPYGTNRATNILQAWSLSFFKVRFHIRGNVVHYYNSNETRE